MSHPSKVKGARFEREVADYLAANGHPGVDRMYKAGLHDDEGDIAGIPGVVIQCRNVATIDLAGAVKDAETQRANAGAVIGMAVIKRRNHNAAGAYAVMTLEQASLLLLRSQLLDEVTP